MVNKKTGITFSRSPAKPNNTTRPRYAWQATPQELIEGQHYFCHLIWQCEYILVERMRAQFTWRTVWSDDQAFVSVLFSCLPLRSRVRTSGSVSARQRRRRVASRLPNTRDRAREYGSEDSERRSERESKKIETDRQRAVSYTHLTLPTICSV